MANNNLVSGTFTYPTVTLPNEDRLTVYILIQFLSIIFIYDMRKKIQSSQIS